MKKIFGIVLAIVLFSPLQSLAADMSFVADKESFPENEEFLVKVYVDSKDATINALEGSVIFSPDFLEFKELREGNSVVNFWVEKNADNSSGQFSFSGITPGGFSGPQSFVFSLVFKAKKIGSSTLAFDKLQLLQNDGLGTKVETTGAKFDFSIVENEGGAEDGLLSDDNLAPEDFTITLAQDPDLFDNKYFIVFSTVDKGSGIDHYEIREGEKDDFKTATSPYLLEDQGLSKKIFVKAIDKNGNERIVSFDAQEPNNQYRNYWILAILGILIVAFIARIVWSKFVK